MITNEFTQQLLNALEDYSTDGVGLFNAVSNIHKRAWILNAPIIYPPNRLFRITIPSTISHTTVDRDSIKLPPYVDFNGCTFEVTNNEFLFYFFVRSTHLEGADHPDSAHPTEKYTLPVTIEKDNLHSGAVVCEAQGCESKLLIVEDDTIWTTRYYNSQNQTPVPIKRKDIFFVKENVIQNDPVYPYTQFDTVVNCRYINVSEDEKIIKNLKFIRTAESTCLTRPILIRNQYNQIVDNVTIVAYQNVTAPYYHDECIKVENCVKLEMKNIKIDRTFSSASEYGYGFEMNNVYDSKFTQIQGYNTVKGVFGTNNINKFTIEDSELTRVDVHCYGRDITCRHCQFHNSTETHRINRVSSFFGTLRYEHCLFDDFNPVRIDTDYHIFTPFDVVMHNCTMVVSNYLSAIVYIPDAWESDDAARPYLRKRCLPNIEATNLRLIFKVPFQYNLIHITRKHNDHFGHMHKFLIDATVEGVANPSTISIKDVNTLIYTTEELWTLMEYRYISSKDASPTNLHQG